MSLPTNPEASEAVGVTAPVSPSAARTETAETSSVAEVLARKAAFPQMAGAGAAAAAGTSLGFLMDVTVTLTAELGRTTITLGEVMRLGSGSVVPLDRLISEPVEITARGVLLARGEVVIVDDRFAIRIKEIVQTRQPQGGGEAG
jgi:flagellar motor switch protein FliN/FliY